MEKSSVKWRLNALDWTKIGKGFLIALAGAVLAYTAEVVQLIEWGELGPFAPVLGAVLVNLSLKLGSGK